MVGFVYSSAVEEEEEEKQKEEQIKTQSFVENKKPPTDPFNFSLPELDLEDFPFSFSDPCLDFGSIKDWIEEDPVEELNSMDDLVANMSDSGAVEKCIGMGTDECTENVKVEEENSLRDDTEKVGSLLQKNDEHGVVKKYDETAFDGFCEKNEVEEDFFVRQDGVKVESLGGFVEEKIDLGEFEKIEIEEGKVGVNGCSIEEELGKVSLNCQPNNLDSVGAGSNGIMNGVVLGGMGNAMANGEMHNGASEVGNNEQLVGGVEERGHILDVNGDGARGREAVMDEDESENEESESESSSSSESSSDSSSDEDEEEEEEEDDDDDEGEKKSRFLEAEKKKHNYKADGKKDMEEGEIMASEEADEMVAWSDDEDDEDAAGGNVVKGPIRSKNEMTVLPPVPPVTASLLPHHQTLPVGVILSILGAQVIVEGVERHNPLNEGSILWITDSRSPLGVVDEIFGPVKNPYYIVRYNSESEVPAGIQQGTLISFVQEFANHVLNNDSLYKKGYDASGENDEELSDEVEFSDDEKEAEYRRMQKMKKRGTNDEKIENKKKDKKKSKNRFGSGKQAQDLPNKSPGTPSQSFVQPVSASDVGQVFPCGPRPRHPFPQPGWAPGFNAPSSNAWSNSIPPQQASGILPQQAPGMGFPNGAPVHGFPWLQPNHTQQVYRAPFQSGVPLQQQININPSLPSNLVMVGGQSNFGAGPAFAPFPCGPAQNVLNQPPFGMGIQGQHVPTFLNVAGNAVPFNGSQPTFSPSPTQNDAFRNNSAGIPHGRGRKSHHRGGGRFGGGRGRRPPN